MKINLKAEIKNSDGTPSMDENKNHLNLSSFLIEVVLYTEKNDVGIPIAQDLKTYVALYNLHEKLADKKVEEVQITAEETILIKERLHKRFPSVLIIGQVLKLLGEEG